MLIHFVLPSPTQKLQEWRFLVNKVLILFLSSQAVKPSSIKVNKKFIFLALDFVAFLVISLPSISNKG